MPVPRRQLSKIPQKEPTVIPMGGVGYDEDDDVQVDPYTESQLWRPPSLAPPPPQRREEAHIIIRSPANFRPIDIPWGGVGFDEDNQMFSDAELLRRVASGNKAGTSGLGTRPKNIIKRGSDTHFEKHGIFPEKKQKEPLNKTTI